MQGVQLTRIHRILIAVVVAGAVVIAAIGFAGSYAAVRDLAERKGFGAFAPFFPIGVDAGIVVLLALDLLLTWIRIPFPLLRQTAWLLTAATIAFNGAAAWPDPLGVGMHAVIPVLFVVTVEAARHAAGRVAALTADKHMEGVRLSRWLLAFPSTFLLWRRMKLWELRHYDDVIRMEQDRLIYETRLRARYGRSWRRKAPVEALMPLKLTRYGIPLHRTAPQASALPEPEPMPSARLDTAVGRGATDGAGHGAARPPAPGADTEPAHEHAPAPSPAAAPTAEPTPAAQPEPPSQAESRPEAEPAPGTGTPAEPGRLPAPGAAQQAQPATGNEQRPAAGPEPEPAPPAEPAPQAQEFPAPEFPVPVAPGRYRTLSTPQPVRAQQELFVEPAPVPPEPEPAPDPTEPPAPEEALPAEPVLDDADAGSEPVGIPDGVPRDEFYFAVYRQYVAAHGNRPTARQLSRALYEGHGVTTAEGTLLGETYLGGYLREFKERYNTEMGLAG
ncbi:DUF2637 domain-containing protein [Streptomyces sp. WMMB303]|uniref:DUF2637 domain-containing protein n=1 Tax=Streptomyces sp. WMMB303 TaxID=3034154 RepID=UPI0023ED218F|nr:DUF2637 domain-containing protein [Streptomyces sp. WMMB303]MDF4254133.1 DUF2637 domain-containing protein [Streptomyces sp. WMMB303]